MTTVRVPTPLRPYTGGAKEVEAAGDTVGAALLDLAQRYPDVRRHLFDETGALRPYVNVFVNDDDIRTLQGDATLLQSSDRMMILPSIAGGKAGEGSQASADLGPARAGRLGSRLTGLGCPEPRWVEGKPGTAAAG
jgi:molybdopterin converting factor small subunit